MNVVKRLRIKVNQRSPVVRKTRIATGRHDASLTIFVSTKTELFRTIWVFARESIDQSGCMNFAEKRLSETTDSVHCRRLKGSRRSDFRDNCTKVLLAQTNAVICSRSKDDFIAIDGSCVSGAIAVRNGIRALVLRIARTDELASGTRNSRRSDGIGIKGFVQVMAAVASDSRDLIIRY